MIPEVIAVEPIGGYRLGVTFDDGVTGDVDVDALVRFVGVFAPLRDETEFRRVTVDPDAGTVSWPNGANLDPLVLYASVTGIAVETLLASLPAQTHS